MSMSPHECNILITGTTTLLTECFDSMEILNQRLLKLLDHIIPMVAQSIHLIWDRDLEQLVLHVKWMFRGLTLCKKACEVLKAISEKINEKYSYRMLYILVESSNPRSFRLKDLFKISPSDSTSPPSIEISHYISYGALIPVIRYCIFRSKNSLASAESRKTATALFHGNEVNGVKFTSVSTEIAQVLKHLLSLGLKMCEYKFLKGQPELNLHMVQNFVYEICNACPFERLDPQVFDILARYVATFHSTRPKRCSRCTFTTLCNIVVKYDPEPTGTLACLLEEKPLYNFGGTTMQVNSVVVDCHRSITIWMSAIHMISPNIAVHCSTANGELKLLSSLCKTKAFSECMFKECTMLLRLIVSIFRSAAVLEDNILKGRYGREPSQRSDIPSKMMPVIEATNLLALIVKLCSQKTAEESCIWNWEVEESTVECSSFNEFVVLWSKIIEILPTLMKSQVSSVPMGILNAIAEFGETLFSLMQDTPLQRSIVTTVLVYCSTSVKADIRGKAGRALARLIEFESLSEEMNFSMDTFDAIKTNMNASEVSVRSAFSWAFGNWSDVYLENYATSCDPESTLILDQLVNDFHLIIKKSNEDKAKVKYNVYRAAGNLLRSLRYVGDKYAPKIKEIVLVLIDQVGKGFDFKARWNASCALRTVFSNDCLITQLGHEVVVVKTI